MAAKKKTSRKRTTARKAPRKKPATRKSGAKRKAVRVKAPPARAVPRELPNYEAWRALVETAVEKPDPVAGSARKK